MNKQLELSPFEIINFPDSKQTCLYLLHLIMGRLVAGCPLHNYNLNFGIVLDENGELQKSEIWTLTLEFSPNLSQTEETHQAAEALEEQT